MGGFLLPLTLAGAASFGSWCGGRETAALARTKRFRAACCFRKRFAKLVVSCNNGVPKDTSRGAGPVSRTQHKLRNGAGSHRSFRQTN